MLALLFFILMGYGIYRLMKLGFENDRGSTLRAASSQRRSSREIKKTLVEKYRTVDYMRMAGSPRIHRKALKDSLPMVAILSLTVIMGTIIAQDPLATTMLAITCFIVFLPTFWFLNMEARKVYNKERDAELIVSQELADSNDFTIPNDWAKKYL